MDNGVLENYCHGNRANKWNKVSLHTVLENEWVLFPLMRMFLLCHKIDACCQVWLWHHHHGRKMMEHLEGYQLSLWCWPWVMWDRGMGLTGVSYGSQILGSLDLHPLALTAIFWLFGSLWLVCSSSVCLCVVWPQFWTWWCQDLDRPVKVSPDAIISPSKSPPPASVCRAVTRWIYSQQTEICSSVLLVSWGNLWVPQMSLFSESCYFGWCESPAMWPVTERWDYPLRKAVGKKLV